MKKKASRVALALTGFILASGISAPTVYADGGDWGDFPEESMYMYPGLNKDDVRFMYINALLDPNPDSEGLVTFEKTRHGDVDTIKVTVPEIDPGARVALYLFVGQRYEESARPDQCEALGEGSGANNFEHEGKPELGAVYTVDEDHTFTVPAKQLQRGFGPMVVAVTEIPEVEVESARTNQTNGWEYEDVVAWSWVTSLPGPDLANRGEGATLEFGYKETTAEKLGFATTGEVREKCLLSADYAFDGTTMSKPRKKPAEPATPSASTPAPAPVSPSETPSTSEKPSASVPEPSKPNQQPKPSTSASSSSSSQVVAPPPAKQDDPARDGSSKGKDGSSSFGGALKSFLVAFVATFAGLGAVVAGVLHHLGVVPPR